MNLTLLCEDFKPQASSLRNEEQETKQCINGAYGLCRLGKGKCVLALEPDAEILSLQSKCAERRNERRLAFLLLQGR